MKLPLRLSKLRNADGCLRIIDSDGRFVADIGKEAEPHVERILLSVNALGKLTLETIRALYPRAHWPADVEGAKP